MIDANFIKEQSKVVQSAIKMMFATLNNIDVDKIKGLDDAKRTEMKRDIAEVKRAMANMKFDKGEKNEQVLQKLNTLMNKYQSWATS